jgi:hypothetical protein
MSANNQMYELFNDMVKGYKEGNMDIVEQCARCWMQIAEDNPFTYDTPEYDLFFNMQKSYMIWSKGAIDQKLNRRKMIRYAKELCALNPKQPYIFDKKADQEEQKRKQQEIKMLEEARLKKEELRRQEEEKQRQDGDARYVMLSMVKAYNENNEVNFKQFAVHLMDIAERNPFNEGTECYDKFEDMREAYNKHNMRRVYVMGQQLCDAINQTELEPNKKVVLDEPKKVLGVPDEEKKSWFKFLHPWKKEGGKNDSEGSN